MRAPKSILSLLILIAACDGKATGPSEPTHEGVDFGLPAGSIGAHQASGTPSDPAGDILASEFAVAMRDSLGGIFITSAVPTSDNRADIFVLQLRSTETGTFDCGSVSGPDVHCHGRYLVGVPRDGSHLPRLFLEIIDGSIRLSRVGPDRVTGTFSATLRPYDDDDAETIRIDDGTIDVPLIDQPIVTSALRCLIGYAGLDSLPAECR